MFDAGSVIGHVNLETGDFTINANAVMAGASGMEKSMMSAQIGFAVLERAVQGITNFLKDSIKEFTAQEAAQAQLGATLKSTGFAAGLTEKELLGMSTALQETTTYADEAVLGAENLLLTFTNIGKDVFPQALESVLDMSTALGQDLKSSSIQLGKALQDPVQGITALRRVGVNFTDAQKDMIKTMVEAGEVEQAQTLILKELQTEFGGSAKAARETLGGAMKSLENQFGEVKESIGAALVPALTGIMQAIMPVVKGIGSLDKSTIQLALGFVGAGIAIFGIVKAFNAMKAAFSAGISPLQGVLIALAAVAAVVAAVNEASIRARTIHKELADQYVREYEAIDGQVQRYEELKNKTNLSLKEKQELAKVEDDLQKQLGESSTFLDEQSGKWTVNATAVSKYKGERLAMAKAELEAQVIVQKKELKWAQERMDWANRVQKEIAETGKASIEASLNYVRYGGDITDIDKGVMNARIDLSKATDSLRTSENALEAITTGGVATYKEYQNEINNTSDATKGLVGNVEKLGNEQEKQAEKMKKMNELQRSLFGETLAGIEQEKYALEEKKRKYIEEYGEQAFITEWYNKEMESINKKYAKNTEAIWTEALESISSVMGNVLNVAGQVWGGIQNVVDQALKNEEIALENEYAKRKEIIENTITDETEKAAAMTALDEEMAAKKKELQKKQWIASQAIAITNAIMSTAQGVAGALATPPPWVGIPLAAVIAGLGAAQVALIASQPMPEFARGGKADPGFAMVGERGPELVRFERSAQVYNAQDTASILQSGRGITQNFYGPINSDVDMIRVNQMLGAKYRSSQVGAA